MTLDKIKQIAESETVKTGVSFKELIGKELMLGQSRYVCRYGTLSDGHDKITDSQRYYQAIKEMYGIANEMNLNFARAMDVQADLVEAEEFKPQTTAETLRTRAKIFRATTSLESIYITLQDQARMLDEYNKVRLELQDTVRTQYPEGIEQAEPENWQAVGQYWAFKKQVGANANPMTHLPLDAKSKAQLGVDTNCLELVAWFVAQNGAEIGGKYGGNVKAFIEDKLGVTLMLGGKK
jgi:hypothetical protein